MAEIFNFNNMNGEEPESCCETCDLTLETISYIYETESTEELFGVLREFAERCKEIGVREHLQLRIKSDTRLLDHLEFGCCGECDGECNCEDDE